MSVPLSYFKSPHSVSGLFRAPRPRFKVLNFLYMARLSELDRTIETRSWDPSKPYMTHAGTIDELD